MQPRKVVTLLGEKKLLPGKPAAFRLLGWDLKWERPLRVKRVDLELLRKPGPASALARLYPDDPVVVKYLEWQRKRREARRKRRAKKKRKPQT